MSAVDRSRQLLLEAVREQRAALDRLPDLAPEFEAAAAMVHRCLRGGGRVFTCGNGGSAADAQHFAAELSGGEPGRAAIALTVDSSALTAIANDHGYAQVFARQ